MTSCVITRAPWTVIAAMLAAARPAGRNFATTPMGRRSLLATVTWDLLREDGSSAAQWRQSYGLIMSDDDKPKIFASATHAE